MAGDLPRAKFVSPAKCIERPWDLWCGELGRSVPRPDDAFAAPPAPDKGGAASRAHPYKPRRRAGLHRLRAATMPLHGLLPQHDTLRAAVCHMCGALVACSAAARHLTAAHPGAALPAPLPPAPHRPRSRHKKETPPAPVLPPSLPPPVPPAPPPPLPAERALAPSSSPLRPPPPPPPCVPPPPPEMQVMLARGELPVVSIQDPDELPLGDNLTDEIFEIMNSEGIQSADDIATATDWKNIIRDIGNLQDINFSQTTDAVPSHDLFGPTIAPPPYLAEELSSLQFASGPSLPPAEPVHTPRPSHTPHTPHTPQAPRPPATPSTPRSRNKTSKTKFNLREYDANKHCGVTTAEGKPCTRSLTCKAHALSLRRMVEGRAKAFDTLLAEHRASREAGAAAAAAANSLSLAAAAAPTPTPIPVAPPADLPPLASTSIDLSVFNGYTTEQQVNDIYNLLSVEDPSALLADPGGLSSLLGAPLPDASLPDAFVIPEEVGPVAVQPSPADRVDRIDRPDRAERHERGGHSERHDRDRHERTERSRTREEPPRSREEPGGADLCWYSSCPRPLAVCTFNAAHAGGAITLGKKFATVRSNIKSSLSRSQCKSTGSTNNFYYGQNALSLSKSVHMNASKTKPEVRRLIVCSGLSDRKEVQVQQSLNEIFGGEPRTALNGHVGHSGHGSTKPRPHKHSKHSATPVLDLGFPMDPLLADEKC